LDDTDDSLAKLYNQILRFVERDLCRIMDLAEKVTLKPSSSTSRPVKGLVEPSTFDSEIDDDKKGFQILTNVVWSEISRAIVDEIGTVVFAAGRPNDFRKVRYLSPRKCQC
jgi:conserved oligomeric Golgi complex subunit 2